MVCTMDSIVNNYKKITLFRIIALFGFVLIIVGALTPYLLYEEYYSFSLIKDFSIFGIVIIISALLILVGVSLANKMLSVIGAGLVFIENVVLAILTRTSWFAHTILDKIGVDVSNSDVGISGFSEEAQEIIKENGKEFDDMFDASVTAGISFRIGFYLILIGSIIALAALVIDLIKGDKQIEQTVKTKANMVAGMANHVMANTSNEYSRTNQTGFVHTPPTQAPPAQKRSVQTRSSFTQSIQTESTHEPTKIIIGSSNDSPWVCIKCHEVNRADYDFCVFCGQARPQNRICPNCGLELEDHMTFCPRCGTKFVDPQNAREAVPSRGNTCMYCGAALPNGASFCGNCGRPVH